jgi:hypothetical protein
MIPEMSQFPDPSDAELKLIARYAFQTGCRQAFDQVRLPSRMATFRMTSAFSGLSQ